MNYNYLTIKATQSRIDKGLLAIPVSLIDVFPNKKQKVKFYFDESLNFKELNFTPYTSSSKECRIGGMKEWFKLHKVSVNEEFVIQIINADDFSFKIMLEKQYLKIVKLLQDEFDAASDDITTDNKIKKLATISNIAQNEVLRNEFVRLSKQDKINRKTINIAQKSKKETVPYSMRRLLGEIYKGKCQLTNFTFVQKNGKPYFEIHHIDEIQGNYLKNLLVVSPNIHTQFTYSNKFEQYDSKGWLRKVKFNKSEFSVFQYIDQVKQKEFTKKVHQ